MIRKKLLPLLLLLLTAGCGLIEVRTRGFGGNSTKLDAANRETAGNESGGSDGKSGREPVKNDDKFAKSITDLLVGRAHKLTGVEDESDTVPVGKGKFSIKSKRDHDNRVGRFLNMAEQNNPGKQSRDIIQLEACIQELMSGKKKLKRKRANNRCQAKTSRKWNFIDSADDIYLRGVFLELALEGVSKKLRKAAVKHYLESLGNEPVKFRVDVPDSDYGVKTYVLKDVPMHKWPQSTLRHALRFGKEHKADRSLIAKLKAAKAKAPTHKCITTTLVMARDHEGGGRYSEVYWDARARASHNFSEHGDISCAKANSKRSDATVVKALKRDRKKGDELLRAAYRHDSTWTVFYNDFGIPTVQRRNVQVYLRVET